MVVSHLKNLIDRGAAPFFEDSYKNFYCLADDPHYIQEIKLSILVKLGNEKNVVEILNELAEYANDIDVYLSKKAISTLGIFGCQFPAKNNFIIKQLASFIKVKKTQHMDDIAVAFSTILSKNPNKIAEVQEFIEELLENCKTEKAKVRLDYDPLDISNLDAWRVRFQDRCCSVPARGYNP